MSNAILNQDRTRKNIVSVDEATARSAECPISILDTDIFIVNAPSVPDGMIKAKLSADNTTWSEAATIEVVNQKQYDDALAQCISARQSEYIKIDALRAEITMDSLIAGTTPDYTPVVSLYAQIKLDLPKP